LFHGVAKSFFFGVASESEGTEEAGTCWGCSTAHKPSRLQREHIIRYIAQESGVVLQDMAFGLRERDPPKYLIAPSLWDVSRRK
jgi:hypothetical protein